MAYNYTRAFLAMHRESVENLIAAARNKTTIEMEFDNPEELSKAQFLTNNLLLSLAKHYPQQYGQLRQVLRTWTEYKGEKWRLYIGTPTAKIAGRRPTTIASGGQRGPEAQRMQTPLTQHGAPGISRRPFETFSKLIDNREIYEEFMTWVAALGPEVKQAMAEFEAIPTNLRAFNAFKAAGWEPSVEGTTLTLRRKGT